MNRILDAPPERDYLGLPIRPGFNPDDLDLSDDEIQRFTSGDFSGFGLPQPSSMPTRKEAQREATKRSTELLDNWRTLGQILERHEDTIRKRWMKKTKTQRTRIITQAWPNIPSAHRPDYKALEKEGSQLKTRGTQFRDSYVWPYMNLEDLLRGKTLLLFLNSRGRHPPSMFGHADINAMKLGHVSGAVMPAFLNLHTMLLDGEEVNTYGRLVSWDEDEDAMMNTFNGLAYQPGEGLLILEIQQSVLRFLVDCCYSILHDLNPTSMISDSPVKPEPPYIVDSSEYPSLAFIAMEAPYRLPARLEFGRLKALVSAKRSAAVDTIRGLREDPGFWADVLGDWSEHRQERMLDTNGARHPVVDKPLFWERVIGNVLLDAYGSLIIWDIIHGQISHLTNLQAKYADEITPHKELPPQYQKALLNFQYTLDQTAKGPIALLKHGLVASPPLRSEFVREPDVGTTMIRIRSKNGPDKMMWLFSNLWSDDQLFLFGLPGLVDEIENLVQRDPKDKSKFSSWVAGIFSDLGLVAQLRHEIDIYQPWAAGFQNAWVDLRDEIEKDFPRRFSAFASLERNLKASAPVFAMFGAPVQGRFKYPSDKRRTKQTTEAMRTAESNLDTFWAKLDGLYQKKSGEALGQSMQHLLTGLSHLDRTPEWVEPIKVAKNQTSKDKHDLGQSLSSLRLDSSPSTSKFVASQPKTKSKTKGAAQESVDIILEPKIGEDKQPVIKLQNRAYKVFKVLFYTPSQPDLPGEIAWTDFLYAMTATGFAPEKLYGSVWQFTPSSLEVERSIQFHEPHPGVKIPFRNARRIGRRLNRAYGWHGGMFALE